MTAADGDPLLRMSLRATAPGEGHALNISEHTVKFHITSIMTKLADTRTEAVAMAISGGLMPV